MVSFFMAVVQPQRAEDLAPALGALLIVVGDVFNELLIQRGSAPAGWNRWAAYSLMNAAMVRLKFTPLWV